MTRRARTYASLVALAAIFGGVAIADQSSDAAQASGAGRQQTAALQQEEILQVGNRLELGSVHKIRRPGLYGISQSPSGSAYGVVDGRLIRFDPETMQVQSIIREVDAILD